MIRTWLAYPLTRGLDIDDPETTHLRRQIIQEKNFLRRIYQEWYQAIVAALPAGQGAVLELGAGGGFMSEFVPDLITSELFYCPHIRAVIDASRLPFATNSLRGIVMTNVLHHVTQLRLFFAEATRCVRPGGVVAMIEPWVSPWSRFVYIHLHHEPFQPEAPARSKTTQGNAAGKKIAKGHDRLYQLNTPVGKFVFKRYSIPHKDNPRKRIICAGQRTANGKFPEGSFGLEWFVM